MTKYTPEILGEKSEILEGMSKDSCQRKLSFKSKQPDSHLYLALSCLRSPLHSKCFDDIALSYKREYTKGF
jgi:hypothetical protein